MKQTVAISAFAEMLARQSGYTVDFCERFVIEMFKTVADALKESSSVSIKGLGKFTVNDSGNVKFLPDDSFAAEINAPFDCFEPELLDDSATEEILLLDNDAESENGNDNDVAAGADSEDLVEENASTNENASENGTPCEEVVEDAVQYDDAAKTSTDYVVATDIIDTVVNDEVDEAPSEVSSDLDLDEAASKTDGLSVGKAEDNAEINDVKHEETDDCNGSEFSGFDDEKVTDTIKTHKVRWFASGIAVGAIIGAAAVYFIPGLGHDAPAAAHITENDVTVTVGSDNTKSLPTDMPTETADTMAVNNMFPEPKAEVDTAVYDYVTSTLAQLSRKHYGSYEFWVYIYEENKDVISNPDRVEPDTKVRIPSPEKYGINSKDKESVKAALKKSQELAVKKSNRK